jgi:hypothetical protein
MARPHVSPHPGAASLQARPGKARLPQGQVRSPRALAAAVGHGAHGPEWHSRVHRQRPQSSVRPHASPQEKSRRRHGSVRLALPHRHGAPTTGRKHGPHAPAWHAAAHGCVQAAAAAAAAGSAPAAVAAAARAAPLRPHGRPHVLAAWPQRLVGRDLPQKQGVVTATVQGAHAPRWQRSAQASCAHSARGRPHGSAHACGASRSRAS